MKNWIAHGSVVIVRSQYLSASCKHARLPSKMAGHFCNFIKSSFNNFFVWETQSTKPDFYARNFIIPHSDFHSHMIKSTKTLYKWIFKHDRFVLGTQFTTLEDSPRCLPRRSYFHTCHTSTLPYFHCQTIAVWKYGSVEVWQCGSSVEVCQCWSTGMAVWRSGSVEIWQCDFCTSRLY